MSNEGMNADERKGGVCVSKVGINKERIKEDDYMMELREQESEEIKKKGRRESVLRQDMMKGWSGATTRVCSRRDFTYACEVLFREDNRGVRLEIRTNLSDLCVFA